mgnify:CR=1 FL=1
MAEPRPHKLAHVEHRLTDEPVRVDTLKKGDLFLREGTPHIVLSVPLTFSTVTPDDQMWVANIHSGGAWPLPKNELVWPIYNATLDYFTKRHGCQ